jgi:hypothetical protein
MGCRDRRPRVAPWLSPRRSAAVLLSSRREREVAHAVDANDRHCKAMGPSHSGVKCVLQGRGGCVEVIPSHPRLSTLPELGAPQLRSAHLAI